MKLKHTLLAAIAVCTPLSLSAQDAGKADLKKVTSHLDMDGHYFMASNIEGDLAKIARLGNDYMQNAAKNGKKGIPKDIDLEKMLAEVGGDQVFAYGRSAKFAGDHWVNKMFIQTNGGNKGLLSLSGEKALPFAVSAFAPAGSDLTVEMNLDMRQAASMMKLMQQMPMCAKTEKIMEGMSKKMPSGITAEEMLNQLNLRMSLAVKLDDEKREVCPIHPEYTFPKLHSCIRLEGANTIWKEVGPMSKWMTKHETQDDGTILITPHKMPEKGIMKGKKPVILMDEKNNVMWAASSIEFLNECRGDGAKLKDDAAYKTISGGMTSGNGLAYISKQACMELRQVKEAKYKKMKTKRLSDDRIKMIMDHLTESKDGYFAAMNKSADGIHVVLKAPCPIKDLSGCKSRKRCGRKCGKGCKGSKAGACEKCEKGKAKGGECKCSKADSTKEAEDSSSAKPQCKCPAGKCTCDM